MKICPNCNKEFDDSKKFCNSCGTALVEKTDQVQNFEKTANGKTNNSSVRFSEKTYALIIGIGSIILSVIFISSIFGYWLSDNLVSGFAANGALSSEGLDYGNIINMINILFNPASGLLLKLASSINLIFIVVLLILSVFSIFYGISSITKGELQKKQKIVLFIEISLIFLLSSTLSTDGVMQAFLSFISFTIVVVSIIKRIFDINGTKQKVVFIISQFALFLGFLVGTRALIYINTNFNGGYYSIIGKDGFYGYIYDFIIIYNNLCSPETIPAVYYVSFALYLFVSLSYFALFTLIFLKKYHLSRIIGFVICISLIVFMIASSLFNQNALSNAYQIAALIFTLVGTTLLTTYTLMKESK